MNSVAEKKLHQMDNASGVFPQLGLALIVPRRCIAGQWLTNDACHPTQMQLHPNMNNNLWPEAFTDVFIMGI